jgi:phage shock protein C
MEHSGLLARFSKRRDYMFCTKCGIEMRDQDRFCAQCGTPTPGHAERKSGCEATAASKRRLVRSMHDKKIAGVCSGFAHYMDLDIVLVRIVWLTLALASGVGFVAYLIAWIVMPKDSQYYGAPVAQPSTSPSPAV